MRAPPRLEASVLRASAFDALPLPSVVLDRSGRIVLANPAGTGRARDALRSGALIGERYRDVCARMLDEAAEFWRNVAAVAGRRRAYERDFRGRGEYDGRWLHVMVRRLDAPDFAGTVVVHHDVTERRRAIARCTIR